MTLATVYETMTKNTNIIIINRDVCDIEMYY